jgi:hypothetical protein
MIPYHYANEINVFFFSSSLGIQGLVRIYDKNILKENRDYGRRRDSSSLFPSQYLLLCHQDMKQ